MTSPQSSSLRGLTLLWLAGNGLRLSILAVPPVLALIILDLKLTGTQVGILNAIPVFLFGLVAIPGSLLIARVGAVPALIIGLVIAAAGSALRGLALDALTLYGATVLMAAGVAVMQPALPPTVNQWMPQRIGFATAVYTNGLLFGEIFPVVLAGIALSLAGGWRASLALWSIPLLCIALIIFLFQPGGSGAAVTRPKRWMPDWRDPLLWKLGLILSGASMYIMSGFTLGMDEKLVIVSGFIQGLGTGLIFVPLSTIAFATLDTRYRNEGAAMFTLIRNIGSAIGISVLQAMTIRNAATVHSRLVEGIRPDNPVLGWHLPDFDFNLPSAVASLNAEITRQAAMVSYVDAYWGLFLVTLAMAPMILFMRPSRRKPTDEDLGLHME